MKDSVIIVSGGMDSITLLHEKVEEIALAVTFDYGSNHNKREAECAARHCQQLGIEHIIIPLAFIGQYFKSSLLEGADAVPEGHYEAENMKSTVVPFFGRYYFAYIPSPKGRILDISKVARVVGYCAARLQLQERLARDIVQMLSEALNNEALGFAIVMKGQHLCKTMRGVRNDGKMSVAHFTGVFNLNSDLRKEFYKLIDLNSNG